MPTNSVNCRSCGTAIGGSLNISLSQSLYGGLCFDCYLKANEIDSGAEDELEYDPTNTEVHLSKPIPKSAIYQHEELGQLVADVWKEDWVVPRIFPHLAQFCWAESACDFDGNQIPIDVTDEIRNWEESAAQAFAAEYGFRCAGAIEFSRCV